MLIVLKNTPNLSLFTFVLDLKYDMMPSWIAPNQRLTVSVALWRSGMFPFRTGLKRLRFKVVKHEEIAISPRIEFAEKLDVCSAYIERLILARFDGI